MSTQDDKTPRASAPPMPDRDTPTALPAPPRGRRDDHGPVELSDIERALCAPSADPGRFVGRGDDYDEPLYQWQVRAIVHVLRELPVEQRMEAMGMVPAGWFWRSTIGGGMTIYTDTLPNGCEPVDLNAWRAWEEADRG